MDAFIAFDPSSPYMLLQINSLMFTKLLQKLGVSNYIDTCKNLCDSLWNAVITSEPDAEGNYIERGLYECENDQSERNLCFNKVCIKPA